MKVNIFLEKSWLIVAILASILTLYLIVLDGFDAAKYYLLILGIVWGMYFFRRGIRKRLEKFENDKKQDPKK